MKMNKIEPLDLILITTSMGRIKGRTRTHKIIYLEQLLSSREDVTFRPYYYGPYSDQLALGLSEAVGLGYLIEHLYMSLDQQGIVMYEYELTTAIRELIEKEILIKPDFKVIQDAIRKIRNATDSLTCTQLSLMAKIIYVLSSEGDELPLTVEEIVGKAKEYKWKDIDETKIRNTIDPILIDLDLVRRS
jgi:uncharacterized protein YwgA